MILSKSMDFRIFQGLSGGLACSLSLLVLSSTMTRQTFNWTKEQSDWFWKNRLYLTLVLGFPLGFIVSYNQKTVLEHVSPMVMLKFDNKIE